MAALEANFFFNSKRAGLKIVVLSIMKPFWNGGSEGGIPCVLSHCYFSLTVKINAMFSFLF